MRVCAFMPERVPCEGVVSESGGPKTLTHAELDAAVKSLHGVGGLYELVAQVVEHDNRPHCTGESS